MGLLDFVRLFFLRDFREFSSNVGTQADDFSSRKPSKRHCGGPGTTRALFSHPVRALVVASGSLLLGSPLILVEIAPDEMTEIVLRTRW